MGYIHRHTASLWEAPMNQGTLLGKVTTLPLSQTNPLDAWYPSPASRRQSPFSRTA